MLVKKKKSRSSNREMVQEKKIEYNNNVEDTKQL